MYGYGMGMGGSAPTTFMTDLIGAGGMSGSRPTSYIGAPAQTSARAGMMGAGNFASVRGNPRLQDTQAGKDAILAYQLKQQREAGLGVRPGHMPQMSAVAAARMQGQQSALMQQMAGRNPGDPRNAVLGAYPQPMPSQTPGPQRY